MKSKWEPTKDMILRKCPDMVKIEPKFSYLYPGCREVERVPEMQRCILRECAAYFFDGENEPICKKYAGRLFISKVPGERPGEEAEDGK